MLEIINAQKQTHKMDNIFTLETLYRENQHQLDIYIGKKNTKCLKKIAHNKYIRGTLFLPWKP